MAINKPNGLLVHRTRIAEEKKEFAMQLLRDQLNQHVYPVHRLDRATSGVLLFGKSKEVLAPLTQAFEAREPDKTYYAVARGYTPDFGSIDSPIRPDKDHKHKAPQEALTHFQRVATVELPIPVGRYATARYSLVKVKPETGRMHQIRKHFAHLRHYLIGDRRHGDTYHNKMFRETLHYPYMLLHAAEFKFVHPFTKEEMCINAQLPVHMLQLCHTFGWYDVLAQQQELPQPLPNPSQLAFKLEKVSGETL